MIWDRATLLLRQNKSKKMARKQDIIYERLKRGETVYMKDDFYDMALRFYMSEDGREIYYRKFRMGYCFPGERRIDPKVSDTAYEVILGGEFITKEEYDEFDKLPPQY